MPTWGIVAIVAVVVLFLFFRFRKKPAIKAAGGASLGVQLRKASENIPIYGTFVKAAGVVGKPVNSALDKVNKGITTGLEHIPVAGHYLAMPNKIAGSTVKKINDWIGL